ncbi:TIR domain-containing protein [Nonomuraea phyllanthi]|uniref:TIR domain-containing protein n=2 Tax=Nonomuraea phyllanthi TaxID=2219224 RepID=A0A5C4WP05_9ACTN|nr:TIR domain-containing protein [Nonomuraea phyllanthi]
MVMAASDVSFPPPRVFISYSWDNDDHMAWVLQLATRLVGNGIDVVLDRWDAYLGADLPLFMEQAVSSSSRVLVVATSQYSEKADAAKGGVGYERRLLTVDIMKDLTSDRIITLLRNNPTSVLPRFLGAPIYLDFRDDDDYETQYAELIHNLYGRKILPRPPLGLSPFAAVPAEEVPSILRHEAARYASPSLSGAAVFDYSNNDGKYTLGSGDMVFTLKTSNSGPGSIYVYNDPDNIVTVALAMNVRTPSEVEDASMYDASSRVRTICVGDAAILRNRNGYWAVVCIDEVHTRESSPDGKPFVRFRYAIQPDRTVNAFHPE